MVAAKPLILLMLMIYMGNVQLQTQPFGISAISAVHMSFTSYNGSIACTALAFWGHHRLCQLLCTICGGVHGNAGNYCGQHWWCHCLLCCAGYYAGETCSAFWLPWCQWGNRRDEGFRIRFNASNQPSRQILVHSSYFHSVQYCKWSFEYKRLLYLLLWTFNHNCNYKDWQNTLHLDSDMHYYVHILACTRTRINIADETAQPRKNAMEDVTTTSDQGPPATGCVARLMRRAWRWSFSVSFFSSILCKFSLWGIFPLWRVTLPFCRNCGVYLGAKGVDRAKDARIRAKKARDKRKNRNYQEHSCSVRNYRLCPHSNCYFNLSHWSWLCPFSKTVPDNFQN